MMSTVHRLWIPVSLYPSCSIAVEPSPAVPASGSSAQPQPPQPPGGSWLADIDSCGLEQRCVCSGCRFSAWPRHEAQCTHAWLTSTAASQPNFGHPRWLSSKVHQPASGHERQRVRPEKMMTVSRLECETPSGQNALPTPASYKAGETPPAHTDVRHRREVMTKQHPDRRYRYRCQLRPEAATARQRQRFHAS
jgi:hypothetical protein